MKRQPYHNPSGTHGTMYRFDDGEYVTVEQGPDTTTTNWSTVHSLAQVLSVALPLVEMPVTEAQATIRFDSVENGRLKEIDIDTNVATGIAVAETDPDNVKVFRIDHLNDSITWTEPRAMFTDSDVKRPQIGVTSTGITPKVLDLMLATATPDILSNRDRLLSILSDEYPR